MSMYVNHAPRLETHSRMHASAYQYMNMDTYTHICMCICTCICICMCQCLCICMLVYVMHADRCTCTCTHGARPHQLHIFTPIRAYVIHHAPRLETHSRMHASAYQYMHMDIYTHICMCISMCIFVMRGDSRHIRIYTRACCDRAHLFANMNTYTRLCHICVYICVRTCHTRAYSYMHMDANMRIRIHVYVYVCVYS